MSDVMDLTNLSCGMSYADQYGKWLELFKRVAEARDIQVMNSPRSWRPLLLYLGADTFGERVHFVEDELVGDTQLGFATAERKGMEREYVESVCSLRPELADALWKSDCQWQTVGRRHTMKREFVVANYLAYYRPEILEYLTLLESYEKPNHVQNCVVTSCSADKPYPAVLHKAIASVLPDDSWHQVIATGVLGVVPQELWSRMPLYDSGVANKWRCQVAWEGYLAKTSYRRVVLYTEFYASCVMRAASHMIAAGSIEAVLPVGGQNDYVDLVAPEWLGRLEAVLQVEPPRASARFLL